MLGAVANMGLGLLILRLVDGESMLMTYGYAVVYGIGFSGTFTMIQLTIAELFAGPTYGRILGVYVAVDTISASMGIFALGTIRVQTGSYIPAIDLMLGLVLIALILRVCDQAQRPASSESTFDEQAISPHPQIDELFRQHSSERRLFRRMPRDGPLPADRVVRACRLWRGAGRGLVLASALTHENPDLALFREQPDRTARPDQTLLLGDNCR